MTHRTRRTPWRPLLATAGTAGLLTVAAVTPASAATLDDWDVTGIQFVTADCARNEYVVDATFTGTTDDGGGFDKVRVEVWDDGILKDYRVLEVPVGATVDTTAFLSFVGTYLTGAPGVGIVLADADPAGEATTWLDSLDPFFPEDEEGPCDFDVERIGGADRIGTAALLAQRFVKADTVVLARSDTFPDALTAAPLADQMAGPLLLTRTGSLPAETAAELTRLQPSQVIVIGGSAAIQDSVLAEAAALLPASSTVSRIGGADRYATSALIAQEIIQDSTPQMFLATGQDFPDALVLSALAARESAPLVLTKVDDLPDATEAFLSGASFDDLYAAGGVAVISDSVLNEAAALGGATATRYSGTDRYETAAVVLQQFPAEGKVMVATGEKFPDALTAVPVAGRTGAGIALSRHDEVPASVMTEVERLTDGFAFPLVTIVGGEAALSSDVYDQLLALFGTAAAPAAPTVGDTDGNLPDQH
ncbi:cell wall-binding repeat-containing protein [Ornithinicoccus hortensis]|uniref:Putative cell wall binding repeat protein n=1 Tax=Ornithinicoccus hortensis TaxID=82346 RepID=A0A542YP37_9MICO|nr:cell wall-binding repeat-containing protein [Ornithinicoccus hortensis]TQL49809.1 putative cell wall binding repeat protein [Ornithinicoccus hortensis]